MIIRYFIYNKLKKRNDSVRKQHVKNLSMLNPAYPQFEEARESLSKQIRDIELHMDEKEQHTKIISDIGDILLLSTLVQVFLMAKGFTLGVIVAQIISLIGLLHGYKKLKVKIRIIIALAISISVSAITLIMTLLFP